MQNSQFYFGVSVGGAIATLGYLILQADPVGLILTGIGAVIFASTLLARFSIKSLLIPRSQRQIAKAVPCALQQHNLGQ